MKKRYKIILNVDIVEPEKPFPASGDYSNLNRVDGTAKLLAHAGNWLGSDIKITLDKVIEVGEIEE